ncbi:MAG: hypothetical protein EBR79_04330, partial [Proteobacteria bacterium]|nr:hypothetical protein [Pseudomonadota bacterium]
MRIKTITAESMEKALHLIRSQLGPEALILSTRKVPGKNGQTTLEITAAINEPESSHNFVSEQSELTKLATRRSSAQLPQGVDAGAKAGS